MLQWVDAHSPFAMVEQRLRAIELVNEMVGGGSEFMANFERACEALRIPLEVLPPRHPR